MLLTMVHNRRRMVVVSRRRPNIKLSRSVLSVCRAPVMSSADIPGENKAKVRWKSVFFSWEW